MGMTWNCVDVPADTLIQNFRNEERNLEQSLELDTISEEGQPISISRPENTKSPSSSRRVVSPARSLFRLSTLDDEIDDLRVQLLPAGEEEDNTNYPKEGDMAEEEELTVLVAQIRKARDEIKELSDVEEMEESKDVEEESKDSEVQATLKSDASVTAKLQKQKGHLANRRRSLEGNRQGNSSVTMPGLTKPITARRRNRLTSLENTELTEVLTIYEKLKKGRENRVFRHSRFDATARIDMEFNEADEAVPIVPIFNGPIELNTRQVLDFNKYKNLGHSKYFYFSEKTKLLQSDVLEGLSPDYSQLLSAKNFWLNIFDPGEKDINTLFNSYGVHDLTLNDIRERNTEDKVEAFKHYTFFSLRLMNENIKDRKEYEDIDFNIILFKDFIITMHDKAWPSITDILGFLNILITHSRTPLTPDWVIFSCFIEMNQDAKNAIQLIEPEISRIRVETKDMEMSDTMRRIFELELQVYSIGRFLKPKARVLRHLKVKCNKRINRIVMNLLNDINDEFREQTQDLSHFNHILERSQDTFLAIVSADQSREANDMSLVMKRISEVALVFLPMQAISGFFGMNCTVPFQTQTGDSDSHLPFYLIVGCCFCLGITLYFLRTRILAARVLEKLTRKERLRPPSVSSSNYEVDVKVIKPD